MPLCQTRTPSRIARRSGSTEPTGAPRPLAEHARQPRALQRIAAASRPRPARSRAGGARARGSSGCPRRPDDQRRIDLQPLRQRRAEPRGVGRRWRCRCLPRRPAAPGRARPARRPHANARTAPSAATARPDSACRTRVCSAAPGAQRSRSRRISRAGIAAAWSGRARRCSTPARRYPSAETKVGSPPMVRRTSPAASARSTAAPIARMSCHCSSLYGLVTRGVSRTRRHAHVEPEFRLARLHQSGDRRGRLRIGRRGERDMALAGQQAGGGVEADPAGARQIDLGPGVQVGEVGGRALRAVQRLHVGDELDQVAGDEARGDSRAGAATAPAARRNRGRSLCPRRASPPASTRPAPCGRCS